MDPSTHTSIATDTRDAARMATLAALPIAVLVGVLVFWLFGGFDGAARSAERGAGVPPTATVTSPVELPAIGSDPAILDQATAVTCGALLAHLPATVVDRPRRAVQPDTGRHAAYGEPAIVVSCGVPPPTIPLGADLFGIAGVCWWPERGAGTSVWHTVDRQVAVLITVPDAYPGPGQWLVDFAAAITTTLPPTTARATTC